MEKTIFLLMNSTMSLDWIGDELGWNVTNGLIELDFSAQLDTDGTPCIVIDYTVAPKRGFNSWG